MREQASKENNPSSSQANPKSVTEEEKKPTKPREEVIRRLREAGRVVTFFGETDWAREQRWLQSELDDTHREEFQRGSKNELDAIMRQIEAEGNDQGSTQARKRPNLLRIKEADFDPFPTGDFVDGLVAEDRVRLCFKRLLLLWDRDSAALETKSLEGRKSRAKFYQIEDYLKPLFSLLKKRVRSSIQLSIYPN